MIDIEDIKELDKSKFYHVTINVSGLSPIKSAYMLEQVATFLSNSGFHVVVTPDTMAFNEIGTSDFKEISHA